MKYQILFALAIFGPASCAGQSVMTKDTGNIIIDPVEHMPFAIQSRNTTVSLPDSLGGQQTSGLAVVHLFITRKARTDSFEIVKLSTNYNSNNVIDYYKGKTITMDVKRYYPFIADYLKQNIQVKKIPGSASGKTTLMSLLIRFK